MAKTTTTEASTTTTTTTTTKRMMPASQVGLESFRNPNVLENCNGLIDLLATESEIGFDMLYINMPWKSVSMEYASNMPVANLVKNKNNAGLLLWVDSPCVSKANTLLDAWGFKFHSVMHVTSYAKPGPKDAVTVPISAEEAAEGTVENDDMDTTETEATTTTTIEATTTTEATTTGQVKAAPPRKGLVPHGWTVDGVVPSRSRQLWFAVRNTATDDVATPYLKDASFIRKRLQPTSTFEYSKATEGTSTTLSSKKKNLVMVEVNIARRPSSPLRPSSADLPSLP